jgi:GT2 family glycosyltransferase
MEHGWYMAAGGTTIKPFASIIVVNMNGRTDLARCLPAALAQTYPSYEVVVVDNDSTDGSAEYVAEHFPAVRLIRSGANLGFTGGNNLGFRHTTGEYVALLNPDTEADPGWLAALVDALQRDERAGLATSKILLMDQPWLINTCGNIISVAGLTFCRGVNMPATRFNEPETVPSVSGAAFAIKRDVLDEIGWFDEAFFAYLEETDLSLRAMLAGYTCLYVPTSVVRHRYAFRFNERKCFDLEKNRLYMFAKILRPRTLLALGPVLLFAELLIWAYMVMKGPRFVRQKWRSYGWLWRNRALIRAAHARTQAIRRVPDQSILEQLAPNLFFEQMIQAHYARLLQNITTPILRGLTRASLRLSR